VEIQELFESDEFIFVYNIEYTSMADQEKYILIHDYITMPRKKVLSHINSVDIT
jgi:ribosomal protein L25 (general stress protein Ctc)